MSARCGLTLLTYIIAQGLSLSRPASKEELKLFESGNAGLYVDICVYIPCKYSGTSGAKHRGIVRGRGGWASIDVTWPSPILFFLYRTKLRLRPSNQAARTGFDEDEMRLKTLFVLVVLILIHVFPAASKPSQASQKGAGAVPPALNMPAAASPRAKSRTFTPNVESTGPTSALNEAVSIHASGRGNPTVNFGDGHDLVTSPQGDPRLIRAMQSGLTKGLSITSGDLDMDGIPDLITGLGAPGGGIISVNRGNIDAIYPYSKAAEARKASGTFSEAPFLSPSSLFELPSAPDFIEAGDFNADGYVDIAAASRGGDTIYLLPGDGGGNLGTPQPIKVGGRITTMASGDVNRRDGLADLLVGVNGDRGPELLVFEGASGAFTNNPEVISLPSSATGIDTGYLFSDTFVDIAVTAGRSLVVVHGRDRKAPDSGVSTRADAPDISRITLPAAASALAIGKFSGTQGSQAAVLLVDGRLEVAGTEGITNGKLHRTEIFSAIGGSAGPNAKLVKAHVSSSAGDDLLIADPAGSQIHVIPGQRGTSKPGTLLSQASSIDLDVEGAPIALAAMRVNPSARHDLVVLRHEGVNASVVPAEFDNVFTVTTTADDPGKLAGAVSPTQARETTLRETITQAINAPAGTSNEIIFQIPETGIPTITLAAALPPLSANNSLTINGFSEEQSSQTGGAMVQVNGNGHTVFMVPGSSNVISGMVVNNSTGAVQLNGGNNNIVEGNFIGTATDGVTPVPNTGPGVMINGASDSTIGGTAATSPNVIGGNTGDGVTITNNASGNKILGNFVGTDAATHTVSVANAGNGLTVESGASSTTVGSPTGFNYFNFNSGHGLDIASGANHLIQDNGVQGNLGHGMLLAGVSTTTVGGNQNANVANGFWQNQLNGIIIENNSAGIKIQGNGIGVAFSNGVPFLLGNAQNGISILASSNLVGGATPDLGNNIAFNGIDAVAVVTGSGNGVLSNVIAANPPGLAIHLFPGANDGIQAPVVSTATVGSAGTLPVAAGSVQTEGVTAQAATVMVISFAFTSTPNQTFNMQFYVPQICDCTNCFTDVGIYSMQVTTDGSGHAPSPVSITLTSQPATGSFVNATATNANDSTSEFSECVQLGTSSACDYTLSGSGQEFGSAGGSGSFTVTTSSGCAYTPTAADSWVHVTSGAGLGSGTVSFTADPNPGTSSRTSTILVASGVSFTVTEDGPGPSFSFTLTPNTISGSPGSVTPVTVNLVRSGGFTGAVKVTPPAKANGIKIKPATTMNLKGAKTSFTVNVKITSSAVPGMFPFTFSATGAGLTGTQTAGLSVTVQ